jgi:hypothetical protein
MTIEIQNLWLEEKDSEGISSFFTKLVGLKNQGNEDRWNLDMES